MKLCETLPAALLAVIVKLNMPPLPGVPLKEPVAELRVTPLGSAPLVLNVGDGKPEAVTENAPREPAVNVALLGLVKVGDWFTVNVKLCETLPSALLAVIVMLNAPPLLGVPLSDAVPSPLSVNETPKGSAPLSLSVGVGTPLALAVNELKAPAINVEALALVNAGACSAWNSAKGDREVTDPQMIMCVASVDEVLFTHAPFTK